MTAELKGIHAKTFQDLDVIKDVLKLDEEKIAELEKENAELKKKNLDTQDAVTMQMYTNKANKEIADRQLTKAKEIIKDLLSLPFANNEEVFADVGSHLYEAEQFLKEE